MSIEPFSLSAIDLETGAVRWTVTMPDDQVVRDIAARSGAVVLRTVVGEVHRLVCFDGSSGQRRWEVDLPGEAVSRLRCVSGTVAVATMPTHLTVHDLDDGSVRWELPPTVLGSLGIDSWCEDELLVSDQAVELVDASGSYLLGANQQLIALSSIDGDVVWNRLFDTVEAIQVQGDSVYAVDTESRLHRLLIDTGASMWTFECDVEEDVNPVISRDVAFVRTDRGDLHALDLASGSALWSRNIGGVSSFGATASGRTYVSTFLGDLHCLDLQTGEQRWQLDFGRVDPGPRVIRATGDRCLVSVFGELKSQDAATGQQLASFELASPWAVTCSPTEGDYVILLQPGGASRVDLADLTVAWVVPMPEAGFPAIDVEPAVLSEDSLFVIGGP